MRPNTLTKLLPLLWLFLLPAVVQAQVNYAISGNTAYVTNSPNATGNIVIASTYGGYPVTSIGDVAFEACYGLTNVTIPNSVTSIGNSAFQYASLTSVTIPDSVTNIGGETFLYCVSLTSVTIGNSLTSIGFASFYECYNLTSVTIGTNVTSIEENAFFECYSLTSVTIPNSVTSIGLESFERCTSLTNVTVGNSVANIGGYAFAGCTSLTSATFQGNAPPDDGTAFSVDYRFYPLNDPTTVYYLYGTTGWSSTYGGVPTVMLGAPAPQIASGSIGVPSGIFGFTLTGVTHQTVMVEASTNLVNWQPVWTNTLSGTATNFTDAQWTNYPARFYRVSSP